MKRFLEWQIHGLVNFVIGSVLLLSVLLLPEDTFGRILQIVLGLFSIVMLALKTWKFFQRGLLHFTIEDAYIFISAIVILTLIAWSPAYFFGWSVKIAFGITGLVLIILAISDFFRHIPRKEENKG
ncbi:MAG: hypothetical protein GXN97_04565 [Aquificae bacterium]|jgi:hypothetical protein|nr:hypothetical protein [Aquificota bacterium]